MGYVALFQNHEYLLGSFAPNGIFEERLDKNLPTFFKRYVEEEVMDSIPNLGYSENEYEYIVWDKEVYETEKIEVPVYVKVFGDYRGTGKTHTFEVPTNETLAAANKIADLLYKKMELETYKPSILKLQELLEEGKGICYVKQSEVPDISSICELTGKKVLWSGKHQCVVGDPSMVTSLELILHVPEKLMALVIGKGGKNIIEMSIKMRVKKIHVLPL